MDVSTEVLIETGLNVIGFLTAAGLWVLLTSKRRKNSEAIQTTAKTPVTERSPLVVDSIETVATSEAADMAFVSFNAPRHNLHSAREEMPPRRQIPAHLRGRSEIIRRAREMLAGGRSLDEIKRSLPVTDGELALLQSA